MGILLCEQNFRDVWIRNKTKLETSESWPDHSVRDSTRDRKQEPRIQELEEDVDQQTSRAAMQGRGRGIRGFMEQLCGEGGDVYEGWTASERKGSWSVCRRLETGSRQWIGQRTLFKLVGQGGDWLTKLKVDKIIAVPT